MNDYNNGLLPEPCMRLPYGWGEEWKSIELGDGTGYVRLDDKRGTCKADETETWDCVCDNIGRYGARLIVHVMECTECGHTYEHVNGSYEYCPWCGRRVVEE